MSHTSRVRIDRFSVLLSSVLASSLSAGTAIAVEGPGADAKPELGEVVVTAQRRQQALFEVPQSIQAFSGVELESRGIDTPDEALTEIPGASLGFRTSPGTAQYNFRGTGGQGQLGDMAVGFYIDDVPYYTPDNPYGPAIRFFDLESVEVLRGPQGTLYGQGSMGGTIIVRTSNPDLNEFEGRARVRGSNLDGGGTGYAIDGTASIPLAPGKAALRITGGYEKTPGLAESPDFPGETNIDDGSIWDVRAKLLFKPSDAVSVLATYWDTNNQGDFTPTYYSNDPPTLVTGGIRGNRDNRTRLGGIVVDWDSPIGRFKSSTSYNDYQDVILLGVGVNIGVPAAFSIDLDARSDSFNQEFTLTSAAGTVEWILGATYTDAQRTTDFAQDLSLVSPPISLFSVATVTHTDTQQIAFFGEISRSFMDGLVRPLVGIRYYRDNRNFRDADSNNQNVSEYDETFSTVSPRFNISVRPADDTEFYLNIAKGFRSGNFNPQGFVALAALFGVDSKVANPEANVWAYELGGRFGFLGGDLVVEPAVYYNDYSDYQFAGIVGGVALVSLSLDKVKSVGADLVVRYNTPVEGLSLGVSGNVNKTTPENLDPTLAAQVTSLSENEQLPYTPEWNYSAYATLQRPMDNNLDAFGTISFTGVGGQFSNSAEVKSAAIHDISLRLGLRRDQWSLALVGQNLTNDRNPAAIRSPDNQMRRDTRSIGAEFTVSF